DHAEALCQALYVLLCRSRRFLDLNFPLPAFLDDVPELFFFLRGQLFRPNKFVNSLDPVHSPYLHPSLLIRRPPLFGDEVRSKSMALLSAAFSPSSNPSLLIRRSSPKRGGLRSKSIALLSSDVAAS